MRLLKELPEIEEKLESGAMSLTNVSMAASFFKREKMSVEKKREFLDTLENKSSRDAEKLIAADSPKPHSPDRVKPTSENSVEIRFTASAGLLEKIDRLRGLLAQSHPNISLGELVEKLADLGLKEWSPGRPPKRKPSKKSSSSAAKQTNQPPNHFKQGPVGSPKPTVAANPDPARAIPRALKRHIWSRDQEKCCNCDSRHALEIDHICPIALGGDSSPDNLRLLCKACNQRAAIQKLGMNRMDEFIN